MFNRQVLNPAYAGAFRSLNITGVGRAQWVGVPDAPTTQTLAVNGYSRFLHGGLGAYLVGDQLGPLNTFGFKASYAYHALFGAEKDPNLSPRLQIGVQGGIYQKSVDWARTRDGMPIYNPDLGGADPTIGAASTMLPDLDAGLYFAIPLKTRFGPAYPQEKFYVSASVSHLLEPSLESLTLSNVGPKSILSRHYYASVGYTIPMDKNNTIFLKPSANFRMAGPNWQTDINANLFVSPMVFGLGYRGGVTKGRYDAIMGTVGFNASSYLFFGYAYDYTMTRLGDFTTGSHEICVSYTFPTRQILDQPLDNVKDVPY